LPDLGMSMDILSLDDNTKFESDYKNTMDVSEEEKPNDEFDNDSKRLSI
jgi:hypothetical protein